MSLSREWPKEFVHVDASDRESAEAMTLSGSKVELTHDLGEEISNVMVSKMLSMERHPGSDRIWTCQMDAGREQSVRIVTGVQNVHVGDLVPTALYKSTLSGGKKIKKGKLRDMLSDDMLCGLAELGLDERDFPYAAIIPATILGDYKFLDKDKPSIFVDTRPGDRIHGPVMCAKVLECEIQPDDSFRTCADIGTDTICPDIAYPNLHVGDLVTYNTKASSHCTPDDLHTQQMEFPYCIPDDIFILCRDCEPGDDLKPVIDADDHVMKPEIIPNRPNCLSAVGLTREMVTTYDAPFILHGPVVKGGGPGVPTGLLDVKTPMANLVPRYTTRMTRSVKIAPSPKRTRERLRLTGMYPINNIVDITSCVILEYGQPTYAFDYRYVEGGKIIVRRTEEGEELTTLDGQVHKLSANHLIIVDETQAVGSAGIMGGENSEVISDTADAMFESARFNGTCIRKGALALGIRTEVSAKFEKGLDPMNTLPTVQWTYKLVELLGADEVVDGVIDIPNYVPQSRTVHIDPKWVNALPGIDIPVAEQYKHLERMEVHTKQHDSPDGPAGVIIPSWRADMEGIVDLAEEMTRLYGYNNTPVILMQGQTILGGYPAEQKLENRLSVFCRAFGHDEIITYSFISPACYDKICWPRDYSARRSFQILNPLGEGISVMRTTTLSSMLDILARNYNYRNESAKLYELTQIYLPGGEDGLVNESKVLTLGAYGEDTDSYAMEGAVEAVPRDIRAVDIHFEGPTGASSDALYHPGRYATVWSGSNCIGIFGQIHPLAVQNYGVDAEFYRVELSFDELPNAKDPDPEYVPLFGFSAAARDIAVVCGEKATIGTLEGCIHRGARGLLREVALFDIYRSRDMNEGKKSVAFDLTLCAGDCSLTNEEADADVKTVSGLLEQELGAVLRRASSVSGRNFKKS